MIKNLFHITLISYIWKRYKAIIISTLSLFFYFWLIGKLHEDFVSYSHLNDDKQYIGLSFLLKWLAFFTGFIIYFVFNTRSRSSGKREKTTKNNLSNKLTRSENKKELSRVSNHQNSAPDKTDPFEGVRKKEKLRSTADFIIEKGKNRVR